jgi:hypothetical protein
MLIDHLTDGFSTMGHPVRAFGLGAAWAVALVSCSVPTDKSKDIQVLVRPSDSLAVRGIIGKGNRDSVYAFAFRVTAAGDTQPLTNVDLIWTSNDRNVATVEGGPNGGAEVTGINAGYATITAQPAAFEQATGGTTQVRIATAFIVDSVRPKAVRYGEKVAVYGVGVHLPFFWSLGSGDLIEDPFGFSGNFNGLEKREFWVPPPSSTDQPFFFGSGFFGQVADSITVDPRDIFEPDTLAPGVIDINGPGVLRQQIAPLPVLFFNPALAFEPVTSGFQDIDWVRFDQSDTLGASIIVRSTVFGDTAFAFVSDSLYNGGGGATDIFFAGDSGWYFTAGRQICTRFRAFSYFTQPRVPSFAISFKKWPTPRMHFLQFYQREGRYELTAVRGYLRGDKNIPPDRYEDNTMCFQADSNFNDSVGVARRQILVGVGAPFGVGPFGDSLLTISVPYDVDMYRFRATSSIFASDTLVTIQTKSRLQGGVDPSDIDVYVYDSVGGFLGASTSVGSSEAVTVRAFPAEYYVVVVDVAGQPTFYSMCIAKGSGCTPPGSAPPARVTARPHSWVKPGAAVAPAFNRGNPRRVLPVP